MSKILQRTVPCGSCGKSFEATVFESINTDYAPDVPEQILNGNIFRKKCPRCGATTNVEYDVLYHDLKNGTMVWVLQDKMPDYHEKVAIAKKMFSPYKHTRIVSNIAQLREKILCIENGLDDRVVEMYKMLALGNLWVQKPDFKLKQAIFRRHDGKNIVTLIGETNEFSCELSQDDYIRLRDMYYKSDSFSEFDGHFAIVDTKWAEKTITEIHQKQKETEQAEATVPETGENEANENDTMQASMREHPYFEMPVFLRCVNRIFHTLSKLSICKELTKEEVVAFVLSISAKLVGDSYYRKVVEATPDTKAFIDKRLLLYSLTMPSEVRAEWLLSKEKMDREDPYSKRWAIFGDLITNPACGDDYSHAPRMMRDFSDVIEFGNVMTGKILDTVQMYVNSLKSGRNDSVAEAAELAALTAKRKCNNAIVTQPAQQAMQTTDKIPMKSQDQMDESKGTKEKTIDEIEAEKRGLSVDVYIQLKQLEANRKAREEREAQKKRQRKRRLTVLTVIVALIGLALYLFYTRPTEDNASGKSTSTRETSGNPYTNNVLYDYLNGIKNQNTAAATATPKPATIYNGRKFITPDYASVCPFEVKAGSDGDYYIYLKYQKAPTYSQESRKLLSSASYPYESDIAFIVKAGQSYEMDVPIGVYKLYYATGKTFFNTSILFGDTTRYYESDELLTFNASGNYYNGHTITLYEVVNGNLDTDEISEKTFPTR